MKKSILLSVLMFGILVLSMGCTSNYNNGKAAKGQTGTTQQTTQAAGNENNRVTIKDFKFDPATITINKGETVTWTNEDDADHTATGKSFDSGNMSKGKTFEFTFNEAGTFDYVCSYHSNMKGQVVVK